MRTGSKLLRKKKRLKRKRRLEHERNNPLDFSWEEYRLLAREHIQSVLRATEEAEENER